MTPSPDNEAAPDTARQPVSGFSGSTEARTTIFVASMRHSRAEELINRQLYAIVLIKYLAGNVCGT